MAYVYRHIRLDKNIPFYIGIGSDDNGEYKRAYCSHANGRNRYWNNIVSKSSYEVDIIIDDITWEDACKKEMEFIALYKRRKDGGTLSNLTLGGEGQLGMEAWNKGIVTPDETRKKQSLKRMGKSSPIKGTKRPQHVIDAVVKACTGRPAWNKGISPSKESIEKRKVSMDGKYLKGKDHPMFGRKMPERTRLIFAELNKTRIVWNKGKKGYKGSAKTSMMKPINQLTISGEFIRKFDSVTDAAIQTGSTKCGISGTATGRIKFHNGYKWAY